MGWSGLVQPYVLCTPPPCRVLIVTSVLTSFRRHPPRKGSFGTWPCSPLSDPMIRLRSPPRSPLPGSGPGCNETVWFPSADQARRGVSPAIGRVARVAVLQIGAAVPEIRRAARGASPALWVSHRFSHPRNRYRVLAVARDLRRQFAGRDSEEWPTASSC